MERLGSIITLLRNARGFISMEELAQDLDVTPRTIRSDLNLLTQALEGTGIRLIRVRNKGLALDKKALTEKNISALMQKLSLQKDFYSPKERENLVMEALLLELYPGSMTLKKVEELTLSGRSSAAKTLADCEHILRKRDITISKKPRRGMVLLYEEYQWRMAVLEHLMGYVDAMDHHKLYMSLEKEYAGNVLSLWNGFVGRFVANINTLYIVNFIRRYEANNKIRFTDRAFLCVFFYICIAVTRIREGRSLEKSVFRLELFFDWQCVDNLLKDNTQFLNQGLREPMSHFELEAVFVYMLTRKQSWEQGFLEDVFIKDKHFKRTSRELTRRFLSQVEKGLKVDLSSDDVLFESLLIHIRPLILRILFGIQMENPLLADFKDTYPFVFQVCREASAVFTEDITTKLGDSEVGYLAMCVEAFLEKRSKNRFSGMCRVIIVCPEGKGTSSILQHRLINQIPNIQIDRICSIEELGRVNKEDVDLVISTVPIHMENMWEIINVNPLLHEEDLRKIRRVMKRLSITKGSSKSLIVEDMMAIVSGYTTIRDYSGLWSAFDGYFNRSCPKAPLASVPLREFLKPDRILLQAKAGGMPSSWPAAFSMPPDWWRNATFPL